MDTAIYLFFGSGRPAVLSHFNHRFDQQEMGLAKNIRRKAAKKIREASVDLAFRAFRHIPAKARSGRGLRILVYHGVCPGNPHLFNARYVSTTQFEEQILLIKALYQPVSYHDLVSGNLRADKLNVLLTFDDGLMNNYTCAMPLLRKHHVPALFFVTGLADTSHPYIFNDLTDLAPALGPGELRIDGTVFRKTKVFLHQRYVNSDGIGLAGVYHRSPQDVRLRVMNQLLGALPAGALEAFETYYRLMGPAEITEIARTPHMAIGAHGYHHTDLSGLLPETLSHELGNITTYLRKITGQEVGSIAFPYGQYNRQVLDACAASGLKHCFRTDVVADAQSPVALYERLTINPYISAINQVNNMARNSHG